MKKKSEEESPHQWEQKIKVLRQEELEGWHCVRHSELKKNECGIRLKSLAETSLCLETCGRELSTLQGSLPIEGLLSPGEFCSFVERGMVILHGLQDPPRLSVLES